MKGDHMGTGPTNPSPRELPLSNQTRFKSVLAHDWFGRDGYLRIVPAVFHRKRDDVDRRLGATREEQGIDILRIAGHKPNRRILDEDMAVAGVDRELFRHPVARTDRGPEAVVVQEVEKAVSI